MSKTIDELVGSDRVVVRLGARKQRDEDKGEDIVIDPEKDIDVAYAYYDSLATSKDEFNPNNGHSKQIGRTIQLLGLAEYSQKLNESGDVVPVLGIVPFETVEGRAEAQRQAHLQAEADRQAEQDRLNAERAAQADRVQKLQADAEQKVQQAQGALNFQTAMLALMLDAKNTRQAADLAQEIVKKAQEKADQKPEDTKAKAALEKAIEEANAAEAAAQAAAKALLNGPTVA